MRYAYRLKGETAMVTMDYSAKAPATAALYGHIEFRPTEHGIDMSDCINGWPRKKAVKEVAKRDYELVTFSLVEKPRYEELLEAEARLKSLED